MTGEKLTTIVTILIMFIAMNNISPVNAQNQTQFTYIDEKIRVLIEVEGVNLKNANGRQTAIIIDPDKQIQAKIEITCLGDSPIKIEELDLAFLLLDIEMLNTVQNFDLVIHPNSTFTANQSLNVNDYFSSIDYQLMSGIYTFRYDLIYQIQNQTTYVDGDDFYMKISGNPLNSFIGASSTILAVASTGALLYLSISMRNIFGQELVSSLQSSLASPTNKLLGMYKGKTFKSFQNEVVKNIYGKTAGWDKKKCPACKELWGKGTGSCSNCNISSEEAEKIYKEHLENKSGKLCKELVDSVSGKSLHSISLDLGDDIVPTNSIISVLIYSGLALFKPRVSPRMSKKTSQLLFRGISTALLMIFWVQAVGYKPASLLMLVVAFLTGSIPGLIVKRLFTINLTKMVHTGTRQI